MLSFLKNHPFAVEAFFESSLVLTFAVPKEQIESLLPKRLQLDTFNNEWAFVAVAMVQTKELRPKGFPRFMGNDFFLIGYRIFVRYTTKAGKNLRGLYILKSETDKRKMEFLGSIFTHYKYSTTDILKTEKADSVHFSSINSDFDLILSSRTEDIKLPDNSPFKDWKEARRYAGPLPFTFSCPYNADEVLIIEGVRQNWTPTPVEVSQHHFAYIDSLQLKNAVLANAFEISNIPYYWKKGRIEKW